MAQYNKGKVVVTNGSAIVTAAWEAVLPTLTASFVRFSPIHFSPSGARATVYEQNLPNAEMTFGLDAGSADPAFGDTVDGPLPLIIRTAACTGPGTGNENLQDTAAGWVVDQETGRWVHLRPGDVDEEWARIIETIPATNQLRLHQDWIANPVAGDAYFIYENQLAALGAFRAGTPQDWVAAGVKIAHEFSATIEPPFYTIASVAARQLTLSSNFVLNVNSEGRGIGHAVHRDFTPGANLALIETGDSQIPSLLRRNALIEDSRMSRMYMTHEWRGSQILITGIGSATTIAPLFAIQESNFGLMMDGPGAGLNTFEDSASTWGGDEHNDRMVMTGGLTGATTPESIQEEWIEVLDTLLGPPPFLTLKKNLRYPAISGRHFTIYEYGVGSKIQNVFEATSDWFLDGPWNFRYQGAVIQRFRWHLSLDLGFKTGASTVDASVGLLNLGFDEDRDWMHNHLPTANLHHNYSGAGEFVLAPGNTITPFIKTGVVGPQTFWSRYCHISLEAI